MAKKPIDVETLRHKDRRSNIPTAELEGVMREEDRDPIRVAYERRNRDLDPQLVWRGKDMVDWSDLIVQAPPLYIQEKVHPKVLIDDLRKGAKARAEADADVPDLFADFNGFDDREAATEFYQHSQNWTNRMILGDSLQVMASLAEREGLRGQVQCIYLDPPYGIKFNSNFQWSTTSRDVKDGNAAHITREPEQVKAFRDTWRDGIHSYLTYLRDRLTVARDLLADSGSIFVQIGDENVHRVRALMDEVFGEDNFVSEILVKKTGGVGAANLDNVFDYVIWYTKNKDTIKYRGLFVKKSVGEGEGTGKRYDQIEVKPFLERGFVKSEKESVTKLLELEKVGGQFFQLTSMSSDSSSDSTTFETQFEGRPFFRTNWKTNPTGMERLKNAGRIRRGDKTIRFKRYLMDFPATVVANYWEDTGVSGKVYVVQTSEKVIQRCILMTTDPGDLVLDPTCGSGTSAYVAEQWGRRWITIDTSRVALALARARIMGAHYPYYLLADSPEGQRKEAEITHLSPSSQPTHGDIRHGFVYQRVPHIMLKSIANNAEIDVIWERFQEVLEPLRARLNAVLAQDWREWEIPRDLDEWLRSAAGGKRDRAPAGQAAPAEAPAQPAAASEEARQAHRAWWQARIERQREIDASIAAKADTEYLYDKPYDDKSRIRVAGPFTVESLSPHRTLALDHDDELIDTLAAAEGRRRREAEETDFATMVLDNLRSSGVQQVARDNRITFTALTGWPGNYIAAEGRYMEGEHERRAGIFIGPEYGTVQRADLVAAAREAADAGFGMLIACAFNFDAHSADFDKLGRIPVLKARMNPDLHMADTLKNTGSGNLFVVFGEPDIRIIEEGDKLRVKILGVDVFKPQTGEIESAGPDGIACWFIDTDYNEESFFVRHAYFLGANDPYKALKTTLKAEIDAEAWESLHSDLSRPFDRPQTGRIAVKVINHLGDEVMKVFGV